MGCAKMHLKNGANLLNEIISILFDENRMHGNDYLRGDRAKDKT